VPGRKRIAYFVSPHGFGHAARTAAIVEALGERFPELEVDLWTSVPEWFFAESLTVPYRYQGLACDVGLVQKSPMEEDLDASLVELGEFWRSADRGRRREVAAAVAASGAALVVCDIAPFGLDVAAELGLPSVLVENFTWDWIYAPLAAADPRWRRWADLLSAKFARADLRLQLEPVCESFQGGVAVPLVARRPRRSRAEVVERLAIPPADAIVLVSLGGVEHRLASLDPLRAKPRTTIVVPGGSSEERREGNLRLLPHRSPVYHPDLVAAADVVVGKLGYSTVAEAVSAGGRMLYVPRPGFRESAVLERYVAERIPALPITGRELESGAWGDRLPELLSRPSPPSAPGAGAGAAAGRIASWWSGRSPEPSGPG
jgi:hypothetical protein